jgi:hypothetical protein
VESYRWLWAEGNSPFDVTEYRCSRTRESRLGGASNRPRLAQPLRRGPGLSNPLSRPNEIPLRLHVRDDCLSAYADPGGSPFNVCFAGRGPVSLRHVRSGLVGWECHSRSTDPRTYTNACSQSCMVPNRREPAHGFQRIRPQLPRVTAEEGAGPPRIPLSSDSDFRQAFRRPTRSERHGSCARAALTSMG